MKVKYEIERGLSVVIPVPVIQESAWRQSRTSEFRFQEHKSYGIHCWNTNGSQKNEHLNLLVVIVTVTR